MAKFFKRQGAEEYVSYYHKNAAIRKFIRFKKKARSKVYYILIPAYFISPIIFFAAAFSILFLYYDDFYKEFIGDSRKLEKYEGLFEPKSAKEVLTVIGYQVFEDELESHLQLVKGDDSETTKRLGQKQKKMEHWSQRWRHVGLGKKLLTTHLLIPGKTGAGKTELVRSIADEACFATGGGFLFNDGKSDTGMLREFVTQATKRGRETSISVMNLLKPEKNPETNTFSPLNIMHPVKTVEFLGGLIGGGGGDGSTQYFFDQGKAMLFPIVNITYTRNKYFKEGYSLEKIFENTKVQNMVLYRVIMYCMCLDINAKILRSSVLKSAISTITTAPTDPNLAAIEALIEYITQNATKVAMVKKHTGMDYVEIKEIFINCYTLLDVYLSKIWNQYSPLLDVVSRAMYYVCTQSGKTFIGEEGMIIAEIKEQYALLRSMTTANANNTHLQELDDKYKFVQSGKFNVADVQQLEVAFHRKTQQGGNIDSPPADAVQQLAYAAQQWNLLANIFAMYKHVFGQTIPEIKPDKLIKDNRFLYVVLPPLELNPSLTEILGKILVATIKEVAAMALLGETLSAHSTILNIYKDKLTPKPFTFIVLDEYGAYPVDGIDLLLAQIRSLNMSACLAVQDNASLKVGGTDETSQARALANTTKIIAKTEDSDIIEWTRNMIGEISIEAPKLQKDMLGNWSAGADVEIKEEKAFNPERLRDFGNGFALILLGTKDEDLVFVQSFYRGGTPDTIFIKRFQNLEFI